jgi:hypothetical protein
LLTVQRWLARARGRRLDRVDWSDHRHCAHAAPARTSEAVEELILDVRHELHETSVLGEYGAAVIAETLQARGMAPPSVRTIGRILVRRGVTVRRGRLRRPAPPPGWHLPLVAAGRAELDVVDCIEALKLEDGPCVDVLTAMSVCGGLPGAWPLAQARTTAILPCLAQHWQTVGCPAYAQFDNDTRFQGPHQHRDAVGRVIRACVQRGIIPVFTPPRELGLQNTIEQFNALFQQKVWRRVHFRSLTAFQSYTRTYITALRHRRAIRIAHAPLRPPWSVAATPATHLIYIRRTSDRGTIQMLGRTWRVDRHWTHRLVRAEIHLTRHTLTCVGLRRSAPADQPVLAEHPYALHWNPATRDDPDTHGRRK